MLWLQLVMSLTSDVIKWRQCSTFFHVWLVYHHIVPHLPLGLILCVYIFNSTSSYISKMMVFHHSQHPNKSSLQLLCCICSCFNFNLFYGHFQYILDPINAFFHLIQVL
ncbi:hypothetical protein HanRHA438_Chr03g0142411 [Helianthus annuus]|nr:hypothetical protein HanRHA438_Chr03g0142411 [Helianthus annuus]